MKYSAFKLLQDISELAAYIAAVGLVLSNVSGSFNKRYGNFLRSLLIILLIITLITVLMKVAFDYYISKLIDPDKSKMN